MKFSDEQMEQLGTLIENKLLPVSSDIEKLQEDMKETSKNVKYLKREARYTHESVNFLIESFEEGDRHVASRVDNLERIAGITSI